MTEYCPYIKYRRRPAVVPRSPSGRLGCGGRPPPTFAPSPARCRGVAADRRSALGVWPRRPRRSRGAGAPPPACPVAAFRPLAGFCGARRARGRRVPRSVPRALFGFPAPLRRLVKPASPRQPGGGFAAGLGVPSPFLPRAGGGRLCPRSSLCSRLRLRAKPLCPSGRRRCRGRPCSPWGASLFPRVAARCARPALRAPCPLRRAAAAASLAARLPARRRGRRRLLWRFRRAAFSAGSARGDTRAVRAAAAALAKVGGSVRPPTFHRGTCVPISPVIKGKKTRPRQPIHQLGKTTRRYKDLLDTPKIKQKILLFCLILCAAGNVLPCPAVYCCEVYLWTTAPKRLPFCGTF